MKMKGKKGRSTKEKILIFKSHFSGLTNVYGTYDPLTGRGSQVKTPVTDKVLMAHLSGRKPYGVYLLVKDVTKAVAVDFDTQDKLPPTEFVARAKHYGIKAHLERSKSKGHHAWIFFEERGVLAQKARLVVNHILDEISHPDTEVFPKQDSLGPNARYGNFINAPLFGALVPQGKTVFLDPATFKPYPNQWDFLISVDRTSESVLDEIIETNDLSPKTIYRTPKPSSEDMTSKPFSLPPCARKMFQDGVSQNQRTSCFRLAVHLKRLGLPYDVAVAALKTWALKNRPANGKGIIRSTEILSQATYAYDHSYTGFGCGSEAVKPFCEQTCAIKNFKEN